MSDLIPIDEARRRVLEAVAPLGPETVPLDAALGRVLAEDLTSPIAVPPFDSSGMDGYAVVAGPATRVAVIGEARAGHPFMGTLSRAQAVTISTGAVVPVGASAVVPVERAEEVSSEVVAVPESWPGQNIRRAGEDIPRDAVVLRTGVRLGPAELGVAASVGRAELACGKRPRVAVLTTGDELTEPGSALGPGGIYSSNAFALAAQAQRSGAVLGARSTLPDDPEATRAALASALDGVDVLVVSGGVSVGPHDHVKPALRDLGVEERFWGVRLRPGKPVWFGTRDGKLAFGLPGNPVSAMVTFQLFVRPALAALQGASPDPRVVTAALTEPVPRNRQREQAIRVNLLQSENGLEASPTTGAQGSHVLTSMIGADGLALIAAGEGDAPAGERVEVELL